VHPYIRRRNGLEPITYLHPLLENSLGKTLGVPLFQEQLMQMAIDVAGFTASEADQLRQAMGSKRSQARMERLKVRLYQGMAERGITDAIADEIFLKMAAFANYGFPESHSVSFAYLVYSSSYIKLHEPAVFCAALLNAQPMGFWSPHTLVRDARRHGVVVRTPDINASGHEATLEVCSDSETGLAVRLGIGSVRGIGRTHQLKNLLRVFLLCHANKLRLSPQPVHLPTVLVMIAGTHCGKQVLMVMVMLLICRASWG
jgi:error-prone DNA polymerase